MFISTNVPNMRKVRLDSHPAARHLEHMPGQHGQICDPHEEPAPRGGGAKVARLLALGRNSLIIFMLTSCHAIAGPTDPPSAPSPQDAARLSQAAQMIVRVTLISQNCAPFFAVNQAQLQEVGSSLFSQSLARYGEKRLLQAVSSAEAEDKAQIRDSGAAFWCPLQRAYLNSLRVPGLTGR